MEFSGFRRLGGGLDSVDDALAWEDDVLAPEDDELASEDEALSPEDDALAPADDNPAPVDDDFDPVATAALPRERGGSGDASSTGGGGPFTLRL